MQQAGFAEDWSLSMKYMIIPLIIFIGASGARADPLLGSQVRDYSSPLFNITTGVQIGQQNTIERTQTAPNNVYAVEQISFLKPGQNGGNTAGVTQLGGNNVISVGQTIIGIPGFSSVP